MLSKIDVIAENVHKTEEYLEVDYNYQTVHVKTSPIDQKMKIHPENIQLKIRTNLKVPRLGVMLVGWGGNNGSTLTAALEANRRHLQWDSKSGIKESNWFGSITQASTIFIGQNDEGKDVYAPMKNMLPMINPNDIVIDGWDISGMHLGDAMIRAQVLDYNLQKKLYNSLAKMQPRPSIYDSSFIATNQASRADNLIVGTKLEQLTQIRQDIKDFKKKSGIETVIVLWTANTERFCDVKTGLNLTSKELMASVQANKSEISPSILFAMASILEGCTYINGSPQNTFVPGLIEMAEKCQVFIAGDDFKSGQTKLKSVLVDFLVGAGIKPKSIVSYNHLGNNDGKNLVEPLQFRSKEISKSNVVDDMVASNPILFKKGERPDHVVVIKYVPYVADSKRAIDEYTSEIMMGGHNTLIIHNTCEDSLLATPLILDLIILAELCSRIHIKRNSGTTGTTNTIADNNTKWIPFKPALSILSYLCKCPLVPNGAQVVNALFRQRAAIENILRACIGLPPSNHMYLEQRFDLNATQDTANPNKSRPLKRPKLANSVI